MAYTDEHKAKFDNLKASLHQQNRDHLKRKANGGNSILFVYDPHEEVAYLTKAKELLPENEYRFIDVASLLVNFIDSSGWDDFKEYYKDFSDTPHIVFNSDDPEEDLMDLIINEINNASAENKIPVLIRTGALFGTGIENVNIMENKTVMALKQPLVIFYPAGIRNENLYFLNFKPASKYRCTVIE